MKHLLQLTRVHVYVENLYFVQYQYYCRQYNLRIIIHTYIQVCLRKQYHSTIYVSIYVQVQGVHGNMQTIHVPGVPGQILVHLSAQVCRLCSLVQSVHPVISMLIVM